MSGASKGASGRGNGPLLNALISYTFYPQCIGSNGRGGDGGGDGGGDSGGDGGGDGGGSNGG